jgi:hypothetical protein
VTNEPSYHAQGAKRAQMLSDAHRLIDWLQANPDVPVWDYGFEVQCGVRTGELDHIAALAGEPIVGRPAGRQVTRRAGLASYVAFERHQPTVAVLCAQDRPGTADAA